MKNGFSYRVCPDGQTQGSDSFADEFTRYLLKQQYNMGTQSSEEILEDSGWVKISYNGNYGYIQDKYLSFRIGG